MDIGHSTTDFGAAMGWARDLCLQSARTRQDIYLLTDLQRCGLGHTPVESMPRERTRPRDRRRATVSAQCGRDASDAR